MMKDCPIVSTGLGKIRGTTVNTVDNAREVFRYSKVPFAKPPVGELRFEPPVMVEPWNGVLDGTQRSPIPLQDLTTVEELGKYIPMVSVNDITMSEDCLYLTVYTPNTKKNLNMPVLLWFYGGGFNIGSEIVYDGSVLASLHDVVVVIPNYRLGVFGFLALGPDTDYPGNVGLLDQVMAMKWTRKHIENFGGNPNNMTIFGESAGGMSVHYHITSPLSSGCFDKAISHSGTAFLEGFPQKNGDLQLMILKEELNITESDNKELVKQLKSIAAEDIVKVLKVLMQKMMYFGPVVDGNFFPNDVKTMAKESANCVPYISGFNNTEGHGIMTMPNLKNFSDGITKETCSETLKGFIGRLLYKNLPDTAYEKILEEYSTGRADGKMKWSEVYGEILGDTMFVNPNLKTVKAHHGLKNDTYMYMMTQKPMFNHDSSNGPETARKVPFCECDHGDDLVFTFGLPLFNGKMTFDVKFTEDEKTLSIEWMKYLTNFAKNGDPNVGEAVKVKWPKYDDEEQGYLSVQQPCTAGKNFAKGRSSFWDNVIKPMQNNSKTD